MIRFNFLWAAAAPTNGVSEVQRITVTGTPTGGAFTATWNGQDAIIPYNSTASGAQTLLEALPNVGDGQVTCTGGPLPGTAIDVTFGGTLGGLNVAAITTADSFTGGSSPASAVTTPTPGVKGTFRGCEIGCYFQDTANGFLYQNTGTVYVPVWTAL